MDEAERQLLEWLASDPLGRRLVCEPHLSAAVQRLVHDPRGLLGSTYEGPDGSWFTQISQAGRDALANLSR